MKTLNQMKSIAKKLWNDESAQGATEYILLLVVVIGMVLAFKNQIKSVITGKVTEISGEIQNIKPEN
jgi:Flp pilus assembly pilin Flp